jgi:tetratricopeptide (TPR) repeat protein
MDRITQLLGFLAQSPKDPFSYYALALEYQSRGNYAEAASYFKMLLSDFPDYVPAYHMYAQVLAESGKKAEAVEVLETGIEKATTAKDNHAASEMSELRDELKEAL